jgi:hypothetical protein
MSRLPRLIVLRMTRKRGCSRGNAYALAFSERAGRLPLRAADVLRGRRSVGMCRPGKLRAPPVEGVLFGPFVDPPRLEGSPWWSVTFSNGVANKRRGRPLRASDAGRDASRSAGRSAPQKNAGASPPGLWRGSLRDERVVDLMDRGVQRHARRFVGGARRRGRRGVGEAEHRPARGRRCHDRLLLDGDRSNQAPARVVDQPQVGCNRAGAHHVLVLGFRSDTAALAAPAPGTPAAPHRMSVRPPIHSPPIAAGAIPRPR